MYLTTNQLQLTLYNIRYLVVYLETGMSDVRAGV